MQKHPLSVAMGDYDRTRALSDGSVRLDGVEPISERLADPSAPKASLPFLEELLAATRQLMGHDYWPYGVAANRATLDAFLSHHHEQGLSARRVTVEELFAFSTYEMAKI